MADSPPDQVLSSGGWQELQRSRSKNVASASQSRRLMRPGECQVAEDVPSADECALLVDLEAADLQQYSSPSSPWQQTGRLAIGNQKLLTKFQAKKDLEKMVHISRFDEIPLLEEAIENARRAGFEESRVDPLYSQAEETIERLRKVEQRRRAWVRHGDREAAMRHIRPNYASIGDTR